MQRIFDHRLIAFFITIVVIIFLFSLRKTRLKSDSSTQILKQKQQSVAQLKKDLEEIRQRNAKFKSDFYQEKIIRNELLMQRPGEIIMQLPIEEKQTLISPTPTPELKNFQKWLNLF